VDKVGRTQSLSGTIEPGKERRIFLDVGDENQAKLGNSGGTITLVDADGVAIAKVQYNDAAPGVIAHFAAN
jgi:hypothetical protein